MDPKVDHFLRQAKKWKEEMTLLRSIALECGLGETYKWMHPCYTLGNKNIVLIHGFKEYCALLFFKGVLLKDKKKLLTRQTENVQDRLQWRFTHFEEVDAHRKTIITYIKEAIALEQSGAKVTFKETSEFPMPAEFEARLKKDRKLKAAFGKLTPGRQRGYLLYFAGAKQAATREARIDKYTKQILAGKGLQD